MQLGFEDMQDLWITSRMLFLLSYWNLVEEQKIRYLYL